MATFSGTPGNDVRIGTSGPDTFSGLGGNDRFEGRGGDDILNGDDGDDTLLGESGNDVLNGGSGIDVLDGGPGSDRLIHQLTGAVEVDTLRGGSGDDIYAIEFGPYLDDRQDIIEIADGGRKDRIEASTFLSPLPDNVENAGIVGPFGGRIIGNDLNNSLRGNNFNNLLFGRGGNDVLIGEDGDDTLEGESGNDNLRGWLGSDKITGGAGADRFQYDALWDSASGEDPIGSSSDVGGSYGTGIDTIMDFDRIEGDKIVFGRQFDANLNEAGLQDWKWLGDLRDDEAPPLSRLPAGTFGYWIDGDTTQLLGALEDTPGEDFIINVVGQIDFTESDFVFL